MTDPPRDPEANGLEGEAPEAFTPLRASIWMLGAFLFLHLLVAAYFSISPGALEDLVTLGVVSVISFLLMSMHLIGRYPGGPRLSQAIGLRPTHPAALVLGVAVGLAAKIPAEQLSFWVESIVPRPAAQTEAYEAMFVASSEIHAFAILFVVAGLVPLAEEVFFRGAVYGALRRSKIPETMALLVVATGFTLAHADLRQLLPLFFVALMLGLLRTYTGSLLPGLFAHAAFNATAVLAATFGFGPELEELSVHVRVGSTVALGALLFFLVRLVGRDSLALSSRSEEMDVGRPEPAQEVTGG